MSNIVRWFGNGMTACIETLEAENETLRAENEKLREEARDSDQTIEHKNATTRALWQKYDTLCEERDRYLEWWGKSLPVQEKLGGENEKLQDKIKTLRARVGALEAGMDALRESGAKRTPGEMYYDHGPGVSGFRYRLMCGGHVVGGVHRESFAVHIVVAINALPGLLDELERLRRIEESADAMHTATNRLLEWLVGAKMQVSPATLSIVEGLNDAAEAYDAAKKGE